MNEYTVYDGEIIKKNGYYSYVDHVDKNQEKNCIATPTEKSGQLLLKGMKAPKLADCSHKVIWSLKGQN